MQGFFQIETYIASESRYLSNKHPDLKIVEGASCHGSHTAVRLITDSQYETLYPLIRVTLASLSEERLLPLDAAPAED